jgi:hypothetical protein
VRVGVWVKVLVEVGVRVMHCPLGSQMALGIRSQPPHSPGIGGGPQATVKHWQQSCACAIGAATRSASMVAQRAAQADRRVGLCRRTANAPLEHSSDCRGSSTWVDSSLT